MVICLQNYIGIMDIKNHKLRIQKSRKQSQNTDLAKKQK